MTDAAAERGGTARAAVVAVAICLVTFAVNLQMPRYDVYADRAHYGTGMTAVVFAMYVAGLLPALVLLGGVSERIGRKAAVLGGVTCSLVATALTVASPTMHALFPARFLQGLGVGLSVSAGSAFLVELLHAASDRAARVVGITTTLGFGSGALFTTLTDPSGDALVPPSYWVVLVLLAATLVALALVVPALPPRGGALVRLPHYPSGTAMPAAVIAVAWAISGLVVAVVPDQLADRGLHTWAGPVLFLVNGAGAAVQPFVHRMEPGAALRVGLWLLPFGYGALVAGAAVGSLALLLVGAAVAGSSCYGFAYLGGLKEVGRRGIDHPARSTAGYFTAAYVGFGAPSILLGFVADGVGLVPALAAFGVVLGVTAAALLAVAGREVPVPTVSDREPADVGST